MPRRGGNRLKYQVTQALKAINRIGESKREYREKGLVTGIHSTRQMQHALSVCMNFARYLKEQGVRDLYSLKTSHYRGFLDYLSRTGVSRGHLINVETNLRLLAKGMDCVSESKGFNKRVWVPGQRIIDPSTRERPVDRSYADEELQAFRDRLSEGAKIGFDIQAAFGLRLREVSRTRVAHIVERDGRLFWVAVRDREALNTAHGVTKAGRSRETPCRPEYEPLVRSLIQGKAPDEFLSPLRYGSLSSAYYRAGMKKGSHSLRHTYARAMLLSEFRREGLEDKGKQMLRRMLDNRRLGRRKDYGVSQGERVVYQRVTEIVDRVHGWLGHGKGRLDLAEVYMSGV